MLYFLDSGHIDDVKYCNEFFPLAGVTTNPSLVAKEKTEFYPLIKEIRSIIGKEKILHVQTTAKTAEEIVKEADKLQSEIGGRLFLKIPVSEEGLKATAMLKDHEIGVTMTAIFTPQQALIAARAGADYVAPYVNRLDNITADGVGVVADIVSLFETYGLGCEVLGASFKNVQQINNVALAGCDNVTINADLFRQLISHPLTDDAVNKFDSDWKAVYGEKTILDF